MELKSLKIMKKLSAKFKVKVRKRIVRLFAYFERNKKGRIVKRIVWISFEKKISSTRFEKK